MQTLIAAFLALAFVCPCSAGQTSDSSGYFEGRATFYTDNKQGSCHYGAADTPYYAAWPDSQEGFPDCGSCFEVSCVNKEFNDGYGQQVKRPNACYDESKKVVVKIIDSCPCVHANYYSNQRWCCGDMAHIDLSDEVFKMLASPDWGVIGAKFRKVSCDKLGLVGTASDSQQQSDNTASDSQQQGGTTSGWDTAWLKDKVANLAKGGLSDASFASKWQSAVKDTWVSKFADKTPEWVKSAFNKDWRR